MILKAEADKKKQKFTTKIIKKDLNPAWNQVFYMCVSWVFTSVALRQSWALVASFRCELTLALWPFRPRIPKDIECHVWDKDSMSKEFMGQVILCVLCLCSFALLAWALPDVGLRSQLQDF